MSINQKKNTAFTEQDFHPVVYLHHMHSLSITFQAPVPAWILEKGLKRLHGGDALAEQALSMAALYQLGEKVGGELGSCGGCHLPLAGFLHLLLQEYGT